MAQRESVVVSVSSSGVRVVRRDLDSIGQSADRSESSVQLLRRGLGALFTLFAANSLRETLDTFTTMQNRIKALGNETSTTTAIYNQLLKSANDSRTSLNATLTIYQRIAQSTQELGITQREVIGVVDTLNKAVVVSGANAIEARNAMIQLAQGMASGRLQGDELRSVLEQLPYVVRLISKQTGIAYGDIREAASQGKITVNDIVAALQNYRGEVEQAFGRTTPTIEQALTILNNQWTDYIGNLSAATGFSEAVAHVITLIANNLDHLIPLAGSAGVALAAAFTPKLAGYMGAINVQLVRMAVLAAANPFLALVGAIASVTTYLVLMQDQIKLGIDDVTTFSDVAAVMWSDSKKGAKELIDLIGQQFDPAMQDLSKRISEISFNDLLVNAATVIDELVRVWGGMLEVWRTYWARFTAALGPRLIDQLNPALASLSKVFNYEPPWFKVLRQFTGTEGIKYNIDLTIDPPTPSDMGDAARSYAEAYRSGYNLAAGDQLGGDSATGYIQDTIRRAQTNAQFRQFQQVTEALYGGLDRRTAGTGGGGGGGKPDKKLESAYKRMLDSLRQEINLTQQRIGQEGELTEVQQLNAKLADGTLSKLSDSRKDELRDLAGKLDKLKAIQRVQEKYIDGYSLYQQFRDQEAADSIGGVQGRIAGRNIQKEINDKVTSGKPTVRGLDPSFSTAFGEYNRIAEEREKLTEWYDEQTAMYRDFQETRKNDAERYGEVLRKLEEDRAKDEINIDRQLQTAKLAGYSEMFGSLANLSAAFAGQSAGITRALLAFQQAAALAQSIVNIQAAIAQAGGSLPFPANIAAMASVAAATAGIVGTIAGVNIPAAPSFSGNFDAGGNIPRGSYGIVGEYGPEIVTGPANIRGRQSTADYLSRQNNDRGYGDINIYPNDPSVSPEQGATAERNDDGSLDIKVAALITKGGTKTDRAIRASYKNNDRRGTK